VQTDGGSEFEAQFKVQVWNYCEHHRVARPYKKNEQAHTEDEARLFPVVEAFLQATTFTARTWRSTR